jgi:hypothetical protein
MNIKLVIIYCFVLVVISYPAVKLENNHELSAPSYKNFIGKQYSNIKEIDTALSVGQFSALYENKNYAVCIYGNGMYLNKWNGARFNYVLFTKTIGTQRKHAIKQILDIVTIDMNKFNDSARIWLDECDCIGQKSCQTIAIYYHDERMADKEIMVKPLKVWRPNIATGKIEEISPDSVRCGSQAPEEE